MASGKNSAIMFFAEIIPLDWGVPGSIFIYGKRNFTLILNRNNYKYFNVTQNWQFKLHQLLASHVLILETLAIVQYYLTGKSKSYDRKKPYAKAIMYFVCKNKEMEDDC